METIIKIFTALTLYPNWFKYLVAFWVILTACLMIALFIAYPKEQVPNKTPPTNGKQNHVYNLDKSTYNAGRDIIFNNDKKPSVPKSEAMFFKTIALENTQFIYSNEPWPFKVDKQGEDIMNPINPPQIRHGIVYYFPFKNKHFPRIPAKEMFVEFTLENHTDHLVMINTISVEIINRYPITPSARCNFYRPILRPEQDSIILNAKTDSYLIFNKKTYKYAPDEVDKFRLKVAIKDNENPHIISFRLNVEYRVKNENYVLDSDRIYHISSLIESTDKQLNDRDEEMGEIVSAIVMESPKFLEIIDILTKKGLEEAEIYMSKRIEKMKKLWSARMAMDDGGPDIIDSYCLRFFTRIAIGNMGGAKKDILFMQNELKSPRAKLFQERMESFRSEFHKLQDRGKGIILEMIKQAIKNDRLTQPNVTICRRI